MKKLLGYALITLAFIAYRGNTASACISDTITTISVTVNYDTVQIGSCVGIGAVEVRLSNLYLMTEAPGKVCACALASFSSMFDSVTFIAFVDFGTDNPYQGFAAFNEELASSTAWDSDQPGNGGWSGYVASVVNSGLSATDPVEMLIRAQMTNNTLLFQDSFACFDSTLGAKIGVSAIATDEWDPINSVLGNTHQKVRGLNVLVTYNMMPSSYFAQLDTAILNNIPVVGIEETGTINNPMTVQPNPFTDHTTIMAPDGEKISGLQLFGLDGRLMQDISIPNQSQYRLSRGDLLSGMYFLRIYSNQGEISNRKILLR